MSAILNAVSITGQIGAGSIVLTEADLIEIQAAIDAQYVVEDPDTVDDTDEQVVT